MSKRIGTVSIIVTNWQDQAEKVNGILNSHGGIIIGRMGLPYAPKEINIISLIVHGSTDEIGALTGKLGALQGIEVKSVLTRV